MSIERFKSLVNGTFLKAKFCGLHRKESVNPNDGTVKLTYSLILETDLISNKIWVRFTKDQVSNRFHEKFKDEFVGKTMMIPVFYPSPNVYNGKAYQSVFYQGDELPLFFS